MVITTVITKEQHKELKRLSYETDKSMAEIIRAAIDAMLERMEDENMENLTSACRQRTNKM